MSRKQQKALEYRIYYALIFTLSMPWSILKWVYRFIVPSTKRANINFFRRSVEQASIITPMIFQSR